MATFLSIENLLEKRITELNELDFKELYSVGTKYRVGAVALSKSPGPIDYAGAIRYCRNQRLQVYTVKKDHNLTTVFNALDIENSVWVDVDRLPSTNSLQDVQGFYPRISTDYQTIELPATLDSTLGAESQVTLKRSKTENKEKWEYVATTSVEKRDVICVENLSYPYEEQEIEILEKLRDSYVKRISDTKRQIETKKSQIQAFRETSPKRNKKYDGMLFDADEIELQDKFNKKWEVAAARSKLVLSQLRKMSSVSELTRIVNEFEAFQSIVDEIMQDMMDIHFRPNGLLTPIYLPVVKFRNEETLIIQSLIVSQGTIAWIFLDSKEDIDWTPTPVPTPLAPPSPAATPKMFPELPNKLAEILANIKGFWSFTVTDVIFLFCLGSTMLGLLLWGIVKLSKITFLFVKRKIMESMRIDLVEMQQEEEMQIPRVRMVTTPKMITYQPEPMVTESTPMMEPPSTSKTTMEKNETEPVVYRMVETCTGCRRVARPVYKTKKQRVLIPKNVSNTRRITLPISLPSPSRYRMNRQQETPLYLSDSLLSLDN